MQTAEADKLGELQTKLDALRAHRGTLEKQKAQLNDTLEGIAARRAPLTRSHAKGDPSAGKRLDDLDFEERSIRRSLEGVEGNLAANLAEIQPLEAEREKEAVAEGARRRKAEYDAFVQRIEARRDIVVALESELMREFTELHGDLYDLGGSYREMGGGTVAEKVNDSLQFGLKRNNGGWTFATKKWGTPAIYIVPMLPPAHLREAVVAPKPEIPVTVASAPVPPPRRWLPGFAARSRPVGQ